MEVFFVDVGQGSCQVVTLGGNRAIVIDCGSNATVPLRLLQRLNIDFLELLIVSHNDYDHRGGLTAGRLANQTGYVPGRKHTANGILGHFQGNIDRILAVNDGKFLTTRFGMRVNQLLKDKILQTEQFQYLNVKACPEVIWENSDLSCSLTVLSPDGGTSVQAAYGSKPDTNATSAVLRLDHATTKILFAADSQINQWRTIVRQRLNAAHLASTSVDIATVPHHGGSMQETDEDLAWLHTTALKSDLSIVSVGSSNQHDHPRPAVIEQIRLNGSHVMCTQITPRCSPNLESLRPGVVGSPFFPCRSQSKRDVKGKAKSRNVACAGTIRVVLTMDQYKVDRKELHSRKVDQLSNITGCHPLCRQA